MNKSESIKELATALAKAQGEFSGAVKDSSNPFFKSKYADLQSVVSAIKPSLSKHGLSFIQINHDGESAAGVETVILHASGEFISTGVISVPVSKQDAQGYGSAITYARRYSLQTAFGIAPEDDDGNAASQAKPEKIHPKPIPKEIEVAKSLLKNAHELDKLKDEFFKLSPELQAETREYANELRTPK